MAAPSSSSAAASTTTSPRPVARPVHVSRPHAPPPRAVPPTDRTVAVANPAGYIRNANPTSVMTFSYPSSRPSSFAPPPDPAGGPHSMRPPGPHHFVAPRNPAGGSHRASPAAAASKVAQSPAVPADTKINNISGRERSREDNVVTIHGRKVRMSEGASGSLYSLCRSWVRNGMPQESQPNVGDGLRILPKPLPVSMVSPQSQKDTESDEAEDSAKEKDISSENLSSADLLKGHVQRAKKVRARLRKERLLRIERYKQRLSLLLPTQMELIGRNDVSTPKR